MPRHTIQEVAKHTGISVYTLRYYERIGLLDPVARSAGIRHYSEADIRMIEFLKRLRATGMPIQRMQEYVRLLREGDSTTLARQQLLEDHAQEVRARVAEMLGYLELIESKIAHYQKVSTPIASKGDLYATASTR